jgi:hypothetical protein
MSTTRKIIKDSIREEMQKEKVCHHIHKILVSTFKKFEGKKITKRMVTALLEVLPGWHVTISYQYGQINLTVYQYHYNDRETYFLGYCDGEHGGLYREGKAEENHSGFEYYSNRTGEACLVRIKRAEQMLADPATITAIARKVDRFKKAKDELSKITFDYRYEAWKRLELK